MMTSNQDTHHNEVGHVIVDRPTQSHNALHMNAPHKHIS